MISMALSQGLYYQYKGVQSMCIKFRYYTDDDYLALEELILGTYKWCIPSFCYSNHEFDRGVGGAWANNKANWEQTIGLWEENDKIIAAVMSEGGWDGDAFFIFGSLERSKDTELLEHMFHHAETHLSCFRPNDTSQTRYLGLRIPPYYETIKKMAIERGYQNTKEVDRALIMPFDKKPFNVVLPEGYTIADGNVTPAFFLGNTHMFSFNYTLPTADKIAGGFENLRKMPGYNPDLDLVVLDPEGKPVGLAIIWYNEKMPFCELEPLGVVWWCRRKGIARALIYEAANRVMKIAPNCRGMLGGDQQFYWDLGFEVESVNEIWQWSKKF